MSLSIFATEPAGQDLADALKESLQWWNFLKEYVYGCHNQATEEWHTAGKKYGWSFRLKDKKRAILYLIPCDGFFKAALVLGKKATEEALASDISDNTKEIIEAAPVYAEGRGFRIDVTEPSILVDIQKLIKIKVSN